MPAVWKKLFSDPFKSKIERVLPTLFNMAELENKRGNKLGMEVGTTRERVIIALFMYAHGQNAVEFPPTTSPELDAVVCGQEVSIKTKSTKGYNGVKLYWASDWGKMDAFVHSFAPSSDLLYVQILWGDTGGFYLIPRDVQQEVLNQLDEGFFKIPKRNTNPRGVEFSKAAMQHLLEHRQTLSLPIYWKRDQSLLVERALYGRWIDLWDSLS